MSGLFVPFLEVCDIQGGTQPPKSTFVEEPADGYVRLLQIQDFKTDKKAVYIPDRKNLKKCKAEDILIARYGASLGKILSGMAGAYNVALVKTVPDLKRLDRRFLNHFLQSEAFQSFILNLGGRAAQAGFNKADLERIEIPLPPLEEQKRIAGILDQAAELCRLRTRALDKLNTLGQAIFHEMFGSVSELVPLSDLTLKITDGTHQAPEWAETGVPFIFVSNVRGQKISLETQKFVTSDEYERMVKRTNITPGDVIYTCVGSYGNAAVVAEESPFVFQRHIAHLKPDPERLVSTFLAYGLESPSVKRQADRTATGIAQKTVTLKALKGFMFPEVPVADQEAFTSRVEGVQRAASLAAAAVDRQQTLFASLQHRAFRGEL